MQDFFKKIRRNLQKNRYSERFLEELKDHLEDASEEKIFLGETKRVAMEKSMKNLGDPEEIVKNYNIMTHGGSLLAMYLEGFLFGILSVPLYLNSQNLTFVFPVEPFEIFEKIIGTALLLLFIGGIGFIVYSFAFSRFLVAGKNLPRTHWYAYLVALFSPPCLIYFLTLMMNWERSLTIAPGQLLAYFIPTLAIAAFTYYRNHKGILYLSERSILKKSYNKKWLLAIPIYCSAAYILHFSLTSENALHPLLSIMLIPLYTFEFFLLMVGGIIFTTAPHHLSMIGSSWVIAFFLSALGILNLTILFEAIKKKKPIPTVHACLLSLIVPLLLFAPSNFPSITWNVPSSHISSIIEQKQSWPFYRFVRYNNSDHGFQFSYGIFSTGYQTSEDRASFLISQYPGEKFELTNIQSADQYELKSAGKNLVDLGSLPTDEQREVQLPEGFSCEADFTAPDSSPKTALPCQRLKYNHNILYETKEELFLHDLQLSSNRKWALLNIGKSWFNPKEVYLLKI